MGSFRLSPDRAARPSRLPLIALTLGLAAGCAPPPQAAPPSLPGTDIFLFSLELAGDSLALGPPQNITHRPGYDNQPWFTSYGGSIYYSGTGISGETDIYRYDMGREKTVQVLKSELAEYSPQIRPGQSDELTVVRVESDGAQRLWRFGGGKAEPLIDDITTVGYYVWASETDLVMFLVGEPPTLQHYDLANGDQTELLRNPGRTLKMVPGQTLVSFIHKYAEDDWVIMTIDPQTHEISTVVRTLPGREDFAWLPDGRLLMSAGNSLYLWPVEGEWRQVVSFEEAALQNISRLAVSPDGKWLALVSAEPASD